MSGHVVVVNTATTGPACQIGTQFLVDGTVVAGDNGPVAAVGISPGPSFITTLTFSNVVTVPATAVSHTFDLQLNGVNAGPAGGDCSADFMSYSLITAADLG